MLVIIKAIIYIILRPYNFNIMQSDETEQKSSKQEIIANMQMKDLLSYKNFTNNDSDGFVCIFPKCEKIFCSMLKWKKHYFYHVNIFFFFQIYRLTDVVFNVMFVVEFLLVNLT